MRCGPPPSSPPPSRARAPSPLAPDAVRGPERDALAAVNRLVGRLRDRPAAYHIRARALKGIRAGGLRPARDLREVRQWARDGELALVCDTAAGIYCHRARVNAVHPDGTVTVANHRVHWGALFA